MATCQLCNEPAEEPDQPQGAELCSACAAYLDAKFGEVGNALSDLALVAADDPGIRTDMLDFPTAWQIQERGGLEHAPRCSSVPGWHPMSGPGLLCDCGAVTRRWRELTRKVEK